MPRHSPRIAFTSVIDRSVTNAAHRSGFVLNARQANRFCLSDGLNRAEAIAAPAYTAHKKTRRFRRGEGREVVGLRARQTGPGKIKRL
jgi:hypothetical protein